MAGDWAGWGRGSHPWDGDGFDAGGGAADEACQLELEHGGGDRGRVETRRRREAGEAERLAVGECLKDRPGRAGGAGRRPARGPRAG